MGLAIASDIDAILARVLGSLLGTMGFHAPAPRPRRWVRPRPPLRDVFEIIALKGGRLLPTWGISLDFVPHVEGDTIRWHRTDKSARMDLVYDPADFDPNWWARWSLSMLRPVEDVERDAGRILPEAARHALDWYGTFELDKLHERIEEHRAAVRSGRRFGFDNFVQQPLALAFALGRVRMLPRMLSTVHPRYRSPYIAVLVQWVVGLAVPLILGFEYGPITGFVFDATVIVLIIVGVYIACDLACIGYYLRHRREDFNPLLHVVVPILGIAAFAPALLAAAGIQAFSFIAPLSSPSSYSGIVVGVWLLIGIILLVYFASTHPERVGEMSRVHLDETPADGTPAPR